MCSAEKVGRTLLFSWKFLLKILIFDVLSLTAYSPSKDQTNSRAEPNDLFLHAKAVYMMYSPSPQTTTNLPLGLCFKLCG
uniref:Coatomer beta subunit n=1 Tax=Rhizophora mucronata TaxID=61149 RepID=A0A2P2MUL7_RHIMU